MSDRSRWIPLETLGGMFVVFDEVSLSGLQRRVRDIKECLGPKNVIFCSVCVALCKLLQWNALSPITSFPPPPPLQKNNNKKTKEKPTALESVSLESVSLESIQQEPMEASRHFLITRGRAFYFCASVSRCLT